MTTIKQELEAFIGEHVGDIDVTLEAPNNTEHGDYATNAAMQAAAEQDANPREYAEQLVETLRSDLPGFVERVEVAGPGFINFFVDTERLGQEIVAAAGSIAPTEIPEKIVVEHTSPNPNKPLHMGTMRCAVLGDTIARVADALGYTVEVQNLINDLGRQSATTVYAYRNFLDELSDEERDAKADFWVGLLYSKAAEHIKLHPDENNAVSAVIRAIEEGDNDDADLKDTLVEASVHGQLDTAFRTNVTYDALVFERDIVSSGLYREGIELLKELDNVYEAKNREDKGCIVLELSDYEDELGELQKPYKILVRSDGTATYVVKDIVLTLWKYGLLDADLGFEEFVEQPGGEPLWSSGGELKKEFGNADRIINVIGAEQKYPQKVIKTALKALGLDEESDNFHHMHFKFVYLPGRVAYSGRKGNWVGKHGDAVLDRSYELALEEIEERHNDMDAETQEHIAEQVAIAAVRYFLLKFSREKDINFSFEKALDWEGDSGPYLLYSVARAHGILDKVAADPVFTTYEHPAEYELLRELERFNDVVWDTFNAEEPARLTNYLKTLAEAFNSFYHHAPVLKAENDALQRSRLALVAAFAAAMEEGLSLIGIEPLEEM